MVRCVPECTSCYYPPPCLWARSRRDLRSQPQSSILNPGETTVEPGATPEINLGVWCVFPWVSQRSPA
eukprot:723038-Pyramimonas_sp.AAC.1